MKRAIVGSIAMSLAAGVVMAQQTTPPAAGAGASPAQGASASVEFGSIDANRDGRLSTSEVQSHSDLKSAFATLDADRDSYLSQTEYSKWNKAGKMSPGASDAPKPDSATPRSDSSAEPDR